MNIKITAGDIRVYLLFSQKLATDALKDRVTQLVAGAAVYNWWHWRNWEFLPCVLTDCWLTSSVSWCRMLTGDEIVMVRLRLGRDWSESEDWGPGTDPASTGLQHTPASTGGRLHTTLYQGQGNSQMAALSTQRRQSDVTKAHPVCLRLIQWYLCVEW